MSSGAAPTFARSHTRADGRDVLPRQTLAGHAADEIGHARAPDVVIAIPPARTAMPQASRGRVHADERGADVHRPVAELLSPSEASRESTLPDGNIGSQQGRARVRSMLRKPRRLVRNGIPEPIFRVPPRESDEKDGFFQPKSFLRTVAADISCIICAARIT
jgi:hypothetical protein